MGKEPIKIRSIFKKMDETVSVVGHQDKHLKLFEDYYSVEISHRGDEIFVFGG